MGDGVQMGDDEWRRKCNMYCMLTKSASRLLNEFKRNIKLIDPLVCHRIVSVPSSFRGTREVE